MQHLMHNLAKVNRSQLQAQRELKRFLDNYQWHKEREVFPVEHQVMVDVFAAVREAQDLLSTLDGESRLLWQCVATALGGLEQLPDSCPQEA